MANIQRTLFTAWTLDDPTAKRKAGTQAIQKGRVPVFWPRNASGQEFGGATPVEFRVFTDSGNDTSVSSLSSFDVNGCKLTLTDDYTTDGDYRYLTIDQTGGEDGAAVMMVSVVLPEPEKLTMNGVFERLRALEAGGTGGGSGFTPGAPVAPIATHMVATIPAAPAAGADAAALVTWATSLRAELVKSNNTINALYTTVKALQDSMAAAGIVPKTTAK